jgi:hypothetical protein
MWHIFCHIITSYQPLFSDKNAASLFRFLDYYHTYFPFSLIDWRIIFELYVIKLILSDGVLGVLLCGDKGTVPVGRNKTYARVTTPHTHTHTQTNTHTPSLNLSTKLRLMVNSCFDRFAPGNKASGKPSWAPKSVWTLII